MRIVHGGNNYKGKKRERTRKEKQIEHRVKGKEIGLEKVKLLYK